MSRVSRNLHDRVWIQAGSLVVVTASEARRLALQFVRDLEPVSRCELALLDDRTIEHSFGWVFFYQSKGAVETGEVRHALAGNAPIVVTKIDGRVHVTGTAYPLEHYLRRFVDYAADRQTRNRGIAFDRLAREEIESECLPQAAYFRETIEDLLKKSKEPRKGKT